MFPTIIMAISSRFVLKATCLVLVALAVATPAAEGQLSCGQVTSALAPCFDYVLRGGPTVPPNCCYGVKSLYKAAATTADRQAVCYCLKAVTNSASRPVIANAASLPKICGVIIPYTISPPLIAQKFAEIQGLSVSDEQLGSTPGITAGS